MTPNQEPRSPGRAFLCAAGFALACSLGWAAPAWAQVSAEEAGQRVAETYGVQVLKVSAGEINGRAVWLVAVMNPAGDFNEAFQVTTLAVDQADGQLVPSFRHGASGYQLPPGRRTDKVGIRPESMRSGAWR